MTLLCTAGWLILGQRLVEQTGLRRQVWLANDFQGRPVINDVASEPALDFLYDDSRLPRRFFSARWSGFWYLPDDTEIELRGDGDDRLDVWIDDVLVIRRASPAAIGIEVVTLRLPAGVHEIRVEYQQYGGGYNLLLQWAPHGGHAGPLPQHYLFAERPDDNDIRLAELTVLLQQIVQIAWAALVFLAVLWITTRASARRRISVSYAYILDNPSVALTTIVYGFAAWVFLKNAWVHEDAYIIFRSVEQVFAGNGPVWNPHERVQTFTSPLWFGVLVLSRFFSANLYLNAIGISLALWLFTLRNIQRLAPNSLAFAIAVLLCTASTAIHDYTSSGLENVVAYALITYFLLQLTLLPRDVLSPGATFRSLIRLCLAFGLIAVTRHDLVPLMVVPTGFVLWRHRRLPSHRQWWILAAVTLFPLVAWTLFSLVYYGFPWPNTAYAKLNTGVDRADLLANGLIYLRMAILHDAITPATIVTSLLVVCYCASTVYRFAGLGILLNVAYVVWIGGDYMLGRFLSYACLVAVCLLILQLPTIASSFSRRESHRQGRTGIALRPWALDSIVIAVVAIYAVSYHHTPVNCRRADPAHRTSTFRVDSARAVWADMALANYLSGGPEVDIWPNNRLAREGLQIRESSDPVYRQRGIGIRGYMAGTEKIIVDVMALGDPFLARLPLRNSEDWYSGHFRRILPAGYERLLEAMWRYEKRLEARGLLESSGRLERLESLNRLYPIAPPALNDFYRRLAIVTQAEDLWSLRRLKTILQFNLGAYDHLVDP